MTQSRISKDSRRSPGLASESKPPRALPLTHVVGVASLWEVAAVGRTTPSQPTSKIQSELSVQKANTEEEAHREFRDSGCPREVRIVGDGLV